MNTYRYSITEREYPGDGEVGMDSLTPRIGDRVRHHSGSTGTVVSVSKRYIGDTELAGYCAPIYADVVMVQPDMLPRQRNPCPPAQWDGIEIISAR